MSMAGIEKGLLLELLGDSASYYRLVQDGKIVENHVPYEAIRDLLVAINQYELFIGWVEIQSNNGIKNKNMIPGMVLKQIYGRIKHPSCTQLGRARKCIDEVLTKIEKCPLYTSAVREGCVGSGFDYCVTCGRFNQDMKYE